VTGLDLIFHLVDVKERGGGGGGGDTSGRYGGIANRSIVGERGGVVAANRVMKNFVGQVSFQTMAARNLWQLAHNEPLNKYRILQLGGVLATLRAMTRHSADVDMQTHGLQLLWKVGWNEVPIQSSMVELGAVEVVLHAMRRHRSQALVQTSGCWTIFALIRSRNQFNRNAVLRAGALPAVKLAISQHGTNHGVSTRCMPVLQMLRLAKSPSSTLDHTPPPLHQPPLPTRSPLRAPPRSRIQLSPVKVDESILHNVINPHLHLVSPEEQAEIRALLIELDQVSAQQENQQAGDGQEVRDEVEQEATFYEQTIYLMKMTMRMDTKLFKKLDHDRTGWLDLQELIPWRNQILGFAGFTFSPGSTDEGGQKLFSLIDTDADGKLSPLECITISWSM
jgi:hypothetical protein